MKDRLKISSVNEDMIVLIGFVTLVGAFRI